MGQFRDFILHSLEGHVDNIALNHAVSLVRFGVCSPSTKKEIQIINFGPVT